MEQFENLDPKKFAKLWKYLNTHIYLLENPKGDMERGLYLFAMENLDIINDYLSYIGLRLEKDDMNYLIQLQETDDLDGYQIAANQLDIYTCRLILGIKIILYNNISQSESKKSFAYNNYGIEKGYPYYIDYTQFVQNLNVLGLKNITENKTIMKKSLNILKKYNVIYYETKNNSIEYVRVSNAINRIVNSDNIGDVSNWLQQIIEGKTEDLVDNEEIIEEE